MPGEAPIIFIHYGNASYLRHTLDTARRSNPGKRIILLGDESNEHLAGRGVEYHAIDTFARGPLIETFDRVFQLIKGEGHNYRKLGGSDFWTRFVFRRWFVIREFLEAQGLTSFWTFDSDTLILAPLENREPRFASFDCTEQCRAECLNGFVPDKKIVTRYVEKINELFQRPDYLAEQAALLKRHQSLAFTEMNAYVTFRNEEKINSCYLAQPLEEEAFDDALCFTENYAIHPNKVKERMEIKDLHLDPRGAIFVKHLPTDTVVRFITLNLSWMPDYIFERLIPFASASAQPYPINPEQFASLPRLEVSEPLSSRARRWVELAVYRAKQLVYRRQK